MGGLKTEGLDDEGELTALAFIFLGCITASPVFCIVSDIGILTVIMIMMN